MPQIRKNKKPKAFRNVGRTLEIFLDPVLVCALRRNGSVTLSVRRSGGLGRGDSRVHHNLDLENAVNRTSAPVNRKLEGLFDSYAPLK